MKIIITGGGGFLGQKLATALLEDKSPLVVDELLLVDVLPINTLKQDPRVRCLTADLGDPKVADSIIDSKCRVIFHLAAIVSGHAESDFDMGMRINFDATRQLLESARHKAPQIIFVFTSTCGVFGGDWLDVVNDHTAVQPENSYGMEKGMCELLINDYSRKGFIDGRCVRLPTVTVRPGKPNKAVTSFVSGIIREPLNGEVAVLPCSLDLPVWVSSPATVIQNIIHAALMPSATLGSWRVVNLPGITITIKEMIDALKLVAGDEIVSLIHNEVNEAVNKMVVTFPTKFDITRALRLGFTVDSNFGNIIRQYMREELKRSA